MIAPLLGWRSNRSIVCCVCFPTNLFQQVEYVPQGALESGKEYGVSLLHPQGRTWFVQMMACIRAEILKRDLPVSPKWESTNPVHHGEAANAKNLFPPKK